MIDAAAIFDVLRTIPDPEMPISIVDLGLVEAVRVTPAQQPVASAASQGHCVEIDLLPTFVGCPALDMIADDVRAKVGQLPDVSDVKVSWLFDPPWTVDRITEAGRESLREHGVTVPAAGCHAAGADGSRNLAHSSQLTVPLRTSAIPCPFCNSTSTRLESPFGPTRCRMIYYCEACRNSFEHMKRV